MTEVERLNQDLDHLRKAFKDICLVNHELRKEVVTLKDELDDLRKEKLDSKIELDSLKKNFGVMSGAFEGTD